MGAERKEMKIASSLLGLLRRRSSNLCKMGGRKSHMPTDGEKENKLPPNAQDNYPLLSKMALLRQYILLNFEHFPATQT